MASRPASQPTTARRGVPRDVGALRAWISTRTGPRPFHAGENAGAGDIALAFGEKQGRWVCDFLEPGVGHLEDADFVGRAEPVLDGAENPELMAALAFEVEHRVDHVLEDARAGDQAFLGDVADKQENEAAALRQPDQFLSRRANLGDGARRGLQRIDVERLDGIDDHHIGGVGRVKAGRDIAHRRRGGKLDGGFAQRQTVGAELELIDGFLTGNVGAPRRAGQGGGDLKQQRRFADARVAGDQQYRARNQPAAGDAIKLADTADPPRDGDDITGERGEGEPASALAAKPLRHAVGGALLDQGVPCAAAVALAAPLGLSGTTFLANVRRRAPRHSRSSSSPGQTNWPDQLALDGVRQRRKT